MQQIEKISKKILNRRNSKNKMKKIEIDERVDQFDQFEKNDNVNRKIKIHWLFKNFIRKRREITNAKKMHWNEKFHTKKKLKKIIKIMMFEMICSSKKTKHQKIKKFV